MESEAKPKRATESSEQRFGNAVENSVIRSLLQAADPSRRAFLSSLGKVTLAALIAEFLPLEQWKAMAANSTEGPEKKDLSVGFIPITCAAPLIMADPMGFYQKHGLNVKLKKSPGWAVIREWAINKEVDAAHMLSPMPLALTMGLGMPATPFILPAIENVNGQAITLANKHRGVKAARDMKGFKLGVPFDFSMHNYLLRYWLAEGGVDPDKDVDIKPIPPPQMVSRLRAGDLDGYLGPDPFNQRAVYDGIGFIFLLSKDIWNRHPCCSLSISSEFAGANPRTLGALLRSIIDASHYASQAAHRPEIAAALAPAAYLNQPVKVLEEVLTGKFPDGLGNTRDVPDRIDFDPYPWEWMAVWILTQMKRWGQVQGAVDYKGIAEKVYLQSICDRASKQLGYPPQKHSTLSHEISGKMFDPSQPEAYVNSFAIRR